MKFFALLFLLLPFFANASFFVGGGIGAIDGGIIEAGYKMNSFISIRGRATKLPSIKTPHFLLANHIETSGNTPFASINSVKLKSNTFDIGLELRPIPLIPILSKFTIIGAIQYMDMNADVYTNINGTVNFNNKPYTTNGNINVTFANRNKFSPYLGIGIDIINLPIFSLRTTFGASIHSFKIVNISHNLNVLQTDINAEVKAMSNNSHKNRVIPSASLTARITLPNIPFLSIL